VNAVSAGLGHPLFANRSGRCVSVAVVDSGVHATHPHISATVTGFGVLEDGRQTSDFVDLLGHGTAVAAAIMEKAPASDYRIVKVFETRLSTTSQHLVHAVRACVSEGVRLINLSLAGTDADARGLWEEVVGEAGAAGSIIVSACDRRREDLLPGSLAGTIGVIVDPKCPREEFRLSAGEAPTIGASGYPRPIPNVPTEKNLAGVSFAVANATGFLARLLEDRPELNSAEAVVRKLRQDANTA
jgi:subtilisin family serine protease